MSQHFSFKHHMMLSNLNVCGIIISISRAVLIILYLLLAEPKFSIVAISLFLYSDIIILISVVIFSCLKELIVVIKWMQRVKSCKSVFQQMFYVYLKPHPTLHKPLSIHLSFLSLTWKNKVDANTTQPYPPSGILGPSSGCALTIPSMTRVSSLLWVSPALISKSKFLCKLSETNWPSSTHISPECFSDFYIWRAKQYRWIIFCLNAVPNIIFHINLSYLWTVSTQVF